MSKSHHIIKFWTNFLVSIFFFFFHMEIMNNWEQWETHRIFANVIFSAYFILICSWSFSSLIHSIVNSIFDIQKAKLFIITQIFFQKNDTQNNCNTSFFYEKTNKQRRIVNLTLRSVIKENGFLILVVLIDLAWIAKGTIDILK